MNHVQGDVVLRVVIDRKGRVAETNVDTGPVQLIPAATAAVKQWRYRPLTIDGETFEIETKIVVSFQLNR